MKNEKLCGMCNNPAIGKGRIPAGTAHTVYVCQRHKDRVVEFKPINPLTGREVK